MVHQPSFAGMTESAQQKTEGAPMFQFDACEEKDKDTRTVLGLRRPLSLLP